MSLDTRECDICFETEGKTITDIKCCLDKKWCSDCEKKIRLKINVKCPFCRKVINDINIDHLFDTGNNTIQVPMLFWYNRSHGILIPPGSYTPRSISIVLNNLITEE